MSDADWATEAATMAAKVSAAGLQIKDKEMYVNGYNAPFHFWNRRNEIWRVKA